MNFSLHTASQAHLTSFSLPKETPTSLLQKSTASYTNLSFTDLIFSPTLHQVFPCLFFLQSFVCFSTTPPPATEHIFPKGALDWESRWTPEWIPAGHSVLEKLYQHFEFSFLICKNDWVGKTERFLIWNLAPAFLVLTGLLLFPTCVFCVLLFATLLSPSFSLFRVFLVIPLSLYLSPQSSSPFSYCPYPFNPITVFLSNSLSNLKRCFIRIVRFLCIRTWNTLMNSFFFLLEIFFNKCWYYVLNFYLFIWLH